METAEKVKKKYIKKANGKLVAKPLVTINPVVRKVRKFFTTSEDAEIIAQIEKSPTNLMNAFKMASNMLPNRTWADISARWYSVLRTKNTHITCGSANGFTNNIKNVHVDKNTGKLPDQKLNNLLWLMRELIKLDEEDLKAILRIISIK